ncbi:MAG: FtsX-like permease family protein [Betaproteobacteria bacterium]|nr:FtsX-like permease family protein [Betaproteobacteria bacterium]
MSRLRERLQDWFDEWKKTARLDYWLALRSVTRQGRRSAIGLVAIAAGVVSMLLAAGFFEWNYNGQREATIRSRIGHIEVVRKGYMDAGAADPFGYLIPEHSPARKLIETFPQVDTLAPRLSFNGLISLGESTISFLGEGVDPDREKKLSGALTILQGQNLSSSDAKEVILGQGLAQTLGAKVGQNVVLLTNTKSRGIGAVEVRVAGIFSTVTKAYDDYALRLPLRTAQQLLKTDGVHMWLVLLHETSQTDSTLEKMREKVGDDSLQFVPWYDTAAADLYNKTVELFSRQVFVVKVMIAIIIILSITNTMTTAVRERTAEIGTCMALGDTRRTVMRRFLAEGVVMGLAGCIVGVIAGLILARVITAIGIPMPPPPGMAQGYIAGILVTPRLVFDAVVLSVVTAFIAGLYPAWKASRLEIVDALRHAR